MKHLLGVEDLSREEMDRMLDRAESFAEVGRRDIKKVPTLRGLEGAAIWIVGDVLHSRVARSCLLAFQKMGATVTLCGPPTLIPRGIETLGCEVSYDLEGVGDADVVYALRMQRERMSDSFV